MATYQRILILEGQVGKDGGDTFDIVGAPMPIYALQIITVAPKLARRHTANIFECRHLVLVGFVVMIMGTWVVRTVTSQEV